MKKIFVAILMAFIAVFAVNARDIISRNMSDLPTTAQNTLKQNFKSGISVIHIEKDLLGVTEYQVILKDGTDISFDREGVWQEVEMAMGKRVPDSIVPKAILDFIKANNKGRKIIGIEKNRKAYEVTLDNGVELKFDRAGKFLRYDN